jgi:choline transport protein
MPLYASFAIPAGLLMWHKRSEVFLPRDRVFRLGPKVGYFCNAVTIVFAVFINVFFVFPATLPVQASNMSESIPFVCRLSTVGKCWLTLTFSAPDYAVLVEAIAGLIGLGNWYAHARNNFHGPRIELHG